jgi:hypothetical protein
VARAVGVGQSDLRQGHLDDRALDGELAKEREDREDRKEQTSCS